MPLLTVQVVKYCSSAYQSSPFLKIDWACDDRLVGIYEDFGSDRSCLLDIIAGRVPFDSGKISWESKSTTSKWRSEFFYTSSNWVHWEDCSVQNFFIACSRLRGLNSQMAKTAVSDLAEKFKLGSFLPYPVNQAPFLIQKKIQLLSLMFGNPKLILLNKFFDNFDSDFDFSEWKNIFDEVKKQVMIIFTSSKKEIADFYSDHTYQLNEDGLIEISDDFKNFNALDKKFEKFNFKRPNKNKVWIVEIRYKMKIKQFMDDLSKDSWFMNSAIVFKKIDQTKIEFVSEKAFPIFPILDKLIQLKVEPVGFYIPK